MKTLLISAWDKKKGVWYFKDEELWALAPEIIEVRNGIQNKDDLQVTGELVEQSGATLNSSGMDVPSDTNTDADVRKDGTTRRDLIKEGNYNVTYISGGGTEYDDGEWTLRKTPKTITVTKISETGMFYMHETGEKIKIGNGTGNPINPFVSYDSFIVYFAQAGTPYYFKKITV